MPQFLVRTYRDGATIRVVVDGIGEFDVRGPADVEREARATILGYVRSLLPPRPMPPPGPAVDRAFGFDLELLPSGAAEGPASAPRGGARERAAPRPRTRDREEGVRASRRSDGRRG